MKTKFLSILQNLSTETSDHPIWKAKCPLGRGLIWPKLIIALWACLCCKFLKIHIGVFSGRILEQENFGWKVQTQPQPLQSQGKLAIPEKWSMLTQKRPKGKKIDQIYRRKDFCWGIFFSNWNILIVPPLFPLSAPTFWNFHFAHWCNWRHKTLVKSHSKTTTRDGTGEWH